MKEKSFKSDNIPDKHSLRIILDSPRNKEVEPFSNRNEDIIALQSDLIDMKIEHNLSHPIHLVEFKECFTNDLMINLLKEILQNDYDELVKIITIDLYDLDNLPNIPDEGIVIMGGSTHSVSDNNDDDDFTKRFTKKLIDKIKMGSNIRLYGICYGFQSISKSMGATVIKKTYEIGLYPEKITRLSPFYKGINTDLITSSYTRSGHAIFPPELIGNQIDDLAWSCSMDDDIHTFVEQPVMFTTVDGRVVASQNHPEIDWKRKKDREVTLSFFVEESAKNSQMTRDIIAKQLDGNDEDSAYNSTGPHIMLNVLMHHVKSLKQSM